MCIYLYIDLYTTIYTYTCIHAHIYMHHIGETTNSPHHIVFMCMIIYNIGENNPHRISCISTCVCIYIYTCIISATQQSTLMYSIFVYIHVCNIGETTVQIHSARQQSTPPCAYLCVCMYIISETSVHTRYTVYMYTYMYQVSETPVHT